MKDITHIERPNLPWRSENKTECGLPADRHPTWSRDEAIGIAKEYGAQRFAMVVCMTCKNTAERHMTWDQDPASCLDRYLKPVWGQKDEAQLLMEAELRAIALLIEAHRDEFDGAVQAHGDAKTIDNARARRTLMRRQFKGTS